jgi:hypothetical protein
MNTSVETVPTAASRAKTEKARASAKVNKPQATSQKKPKDKSKTSAQKTSKQDLVVAMLRRKEGATVAIIMKVTGWQKHSVHGFFAGVVRKKLQFNLVRSGEGEQAIYRIVADKAQSPATKFAKRVTTQKAAKRPQKPAGKRAR